MRTALILAGVILGPSALAIALGVLKSLRTPNRPPAGVPPTIVLITLTSPLSAVDRMAMAEQYDEIRALPETAEPVS